MLIRFLRTWTLPVAMLTGGAIYFLFVQATCLSAMKPYVWGVVEVLTPSLIFAQLLLTFSNVEWRELQPRRWHLWLLLIQVLACVTLTAILLCAEWGDMVRYAIEGALICMICPTATAAAVITDKLGGSAASITTYTLLCNLLAATIIPVSFPLVESHSQLTFLPAFVSILKKVFPLLLLPFLTALFCRRFIQPVHRFLVKYRSTAFYLWAIALAIVSGQTVRSLLNSDVSVLTELLIAAVGLLTCGVQFLLGKMIGGCYGERISGGQALGQKNTVFAIWAAISFLNPPASLAPGTYVLWQNIINSYQLWRKKKLSAGM